MNIPARPIGQDPQSYWLWIIAKELERLQQIVASGSGSGGPVTIVNGGDVVQGSTTDVRSAATDATAITAMQVYKEISYLLQNKLGVTVADGDLSTLGSKTDAKSIATDTTSVTIMQVMKEISAMSQSIALDQPKYIDSNFTLTRPANTTVYSDGDAILDTVGIATQKFAGIAELAGRGVNFINLVAFTTDTGLAGKTINVVFYKESPASPIADNSAFSYASTNELIRKGTVQLTFGTGILAGVAQTGIDSNGSLNLELCPTATDVYVQVWLPVGYTPSANSTYIILKASVIQN